MVLEASACESARLLLNSRSSRFPAGLAKSSGMVGRYLTDSTGTYVAGHIPQLMNGLPHNEDGVGGGHLYIPWWLDNKKLGFPRGYHVEIGGGRDMPGYGFMGGIHRFNGQGRPQGGGGYGKQLKDDYRRLRLDCGIRGPRRDGGPQRELPRNRSGRGGQVRPGKENGWGIDPPGWIIHELGVTRVGSSPRASVLNPFCQAHEVKNLFVADGGPFVSQAHKNPTWTILALAWICK